MALPHDYIAGFVDGEGCFALKHRADRKYNAKGKLLHEYYYWTPEFAIVLNPADAELLVQIQKTLGVGRISYTRDGKQVRYSVQNLHELQEVIAPFFSNNQLYGNKKKDFEMWKRAVALIGEKRQAINIKEAEDELRELKNKIDQHKRRVGESSL